MNEQNCTGMPLTADANHLLEELKTDIRLQAASGQIVETGNSLQQFAQALEMHPDKEMNYRDTVYQDRYQDTAYDDHYKDNVGYRDAAR